mmetsp:Transcript_27581/g.49726  ORF Transcript_27581/g.49726 Transcript_27581/m.49726 type:complete len:221 (-) Transcript_27581:1813-2475(-)
MYCVCENSLILYAQIPLLDRNAPQMPRPTDERMTRVRLYWWTERRVPMMTPQPRLGRVKGRRKMLAKSKNSNLSGIYGYLRLVDVGLAVIGVTLQELSLDQTLNLCLDHRRLRSEVSDLAHDFRDKLLMLESSAALHDTNDYRVQDVLALNRDRGFFFLGLGVFLLDFLGDEVDLDGVAGEAEVHLHDLAVFQALALGRLVQELVLGVEELDQVRLQTRV